ncbi:MAG: mannitol dehydrogenase family protein, partial [Rhizobium oryzihabitans]
FSNSALRHRTEQIANDGSQKLPQRVIVAALERIGRGLPANNLAMVVAAWIAALVSRPNIASFTDPLDGALKSSLVAGAAEFFDLAGFAVETSDRRYLIAQVDEQLAHIHELGLARALEINSKGITP